MARSFNANARPGLPTHRSLGYGEKRKHSIEGEAPPSSVYEMYDITPREPPLDESQGRWYGANTERISAAERTLDQLVRRQSSSEYEIIDALLDRKMQGSKRAHIHAFIARRDAANPEWKHQLVFLKLNRSHKQRDSKKSKQKTLSMHIILERKLRRRDDIRLPLPRSMSSQGPIRAIGGLPATDHRQENSMLGPVSAPVNTPRSQDLPSYARQRDPNWQSSPPRVQILDNPNGRGQLLAPPPPGTTTHNSDESASFTPASPSSTLSSDTARSSSRKTLYPSSTNDTASIFLPKDNAQYEQGKHRVIADRDVQCPYVSVGTQTDMKVNASDNSRPTLIQNMVFKPQTKPTERLESENFGIDAHMPCGSSSKEGDTSSVDVSHDEQETPKLAAPKEATSDAFEKPAWMNNMQPVYTPTAINESLDPFAEPVDEQIVAKQRDNGVAEVDAARAIPIHEGTDPTPGHGTGDVSIPSHFPKPIRETSSPIMTPKTNSDHIARNGTSVRKDITVSEYFSELAKATRLPLGGYFPPPQPPLAIPDQPRRHSDDASPRQSKSKSVRFDLPTQPNTVPSTPVMGTPPSSPDTTSSSSSPESKWTPKPSASTSQRPSLQRSSHTSSAYSRSANPLLPQPPRSSSYRDLPPSHANSEEKDWWLTVPANVNRRQSASAQNPGRKPYECKVDRCRLPGFASRDELSQHMRSAHYMEHRGSI